MNPLNYDFILGVNNWIKKLSRENAWGINMKMKFQPGFSPIMKYLVGAT